MGIAVSTAATFDVVSLHDVKQFANIMDDDNDNLFRANILAAVEELEAETWLTFAQKGLTWTFDHWPHNGTIKVPRSPLITVASIKYYDTGGTQQTVTASEYRVATGTVPGRIDNADGYTWPATDGRPDGIEIIYTAGYATQATIPDRIKFLVKSVASDMFYCRDPQGIAQVFANPAHLRMIRNIRASDFQGSYP